MRVTEVVLAAVMLCILCLPSLIIAVAIRTTSVGPVFYRQARIGRWSRLFVLFKFRSMYHNEWQRGPQPISMASDPRVTPVGRFLRRTGLDEIPQLFNVLRGDMSLVGPRPMLPYQAGRLDSFQRDRFRIPPGMTGWAFIHGRNNLSWDDRIELDLWYVEHASPCLDIRILLKTPWVLLRCAGTYVGDGDPIADPVQSNPMGHGNGE